MPKKKLTISVPVEQEAILRKSAQSTRTVGVRVGNLAEALRRDWVSAIQTLERYHWTRKQIEHAARASSIDGLAPYDFTRLNLALSLGASNAPDPKEYHARVGALPREYAVLIWQVGRELKLENPEVVAYLRSDSDEFPTGHMWVEATPAHIHSYTGADAVRPPKRTPPADKKRRKR